jgi:hypothetical protein
MNRIIGVPLLPALASDMQESAKFGSTNPASWVA